jgi:hypothetical protein
MRYNSEAKSFGPKEKEKSYKFATGVSAKPKKMDLPIIPKAVAPYISIQVGEDAFFARYDSMGIADGVIYFLYSIKSYLYFFVLVI